MKPLLLALGVLSFLPLSARTVDRTAIDRAIERGVAALKRAQGGDGTWAYTEIGATALAGLTLVECGLGKDDPAVQKAAARVREAGLPLTSTYSLALAVLFLDRLGDPADTPLIESMVVRLLAGQNAAGGWGYQCPAIPAEEVKRIKGEMDNPRGPRDLSKLKPLGKRTPTDLPDQIQAQLQALARPGTALADTGGGDNSNTQFATLALWVGRRYGVPTQPALLRIDRRFRLSQGADGGWGYTATHAGSSTAAMTCAGLLGLACGHGASVDLKKARDDKVDSSDASKDANLKAGLQLLATAIGRPVGWNGAGARPLAVPVASGKAFYFLWSLERVAIILNLETIGKKDWYHWGAEVLLASQQANGSWAGEYASSNADTCFALMFLKRVNLARDLSASIKGLRDPGDKILRAGGVGGGALKGGEGFKPTDIGSSGAGPVNRVATPAERSPPPPRTAEEKAAARLADDLVKSTAQRRGGILKEMRDTKGVAYTEALAYAISRLDVDGRRSAREALAERLARMKPATLSSYLKDELPEIRRAAALACAAREAKELTGELIRLLNDPEPLVLRAAHAALKELTGQDFGPKAGADGPERSKAISAWEAWWKKQRRGEPGA